MVVPLIMGATINTVAPAALEIGGLASALLKTGAASFIALSCFCCGAAIDVRQAYLPVAKGAVLTGVKMALAAGLGWTVNAVFGPAGFAGILPLAIIPALSNANGGLYIALSNEYGDASDVGAQAILVLNEGPFFTMLAFGATGMADIPLVALLASVLPLLLGFVLGNLDPDIRRFAAYPEILIPFMAFCVGAAMNLADVVNAGGQGVALGLACLLLCGTAGYLSTRLFNPRFRAVGAAIGATAGNAVPTPMLLAAADPSLLPFVKTATAQVAASVMVTAILCPMLTARLYRRERLGEIDGS